jgi:hypothetical protein
MCAMCALPDSSYRMSCAVRADAPYLLGHDSLIQRHVIIIRCLTLGWCRCMGRRESVRLSRYQCAYLSSEAGDLCDMGGAMRAGWYGWYAGVPFFRSLRPCVSCVFLFAACLHLSPLRSLCARAGDPGSGLVSPPSALPFVDPEPS